MSNNKSVVKIESKEYVVRVEGTANSFGIGEVVAPRCTLFKAGMYNLTREAAERGAKHLKISFPYSERKTA
jgi:hypothetical protein